MKDNIHPQFYTTAIVTCACGNTFSTGSTLKELHTEICSNCHPFYTGKQKILDTAGKVEKFKKHQAIAKARMESVIPKKERKTRTKK